MNLMFRLNRDLARLCAKFPQYRASLNEVHHIHKLDKPSGTAITLAEGILAEHAGYEKWVCDPRKPVSNGTLPVTTHREGDVKGIHTAVWKSNLDEVSISHHAISRDAFAQGALVAAEWLIGRKGIYSFEDILGGV